MTASVNQYAQSAPLSDLNGLRGIVNDPSITERQKMAETSRQFEAIMLRQILNDAMKPTIKGGVFDESGGAANIYRSMMTDVVSNAMAQGGGIGLATSLQAQLNDFVYEKEELISNQDDNHI